jgi:hypothetical protein
MKRQPAFCSDEDGLYDVGRVRVNATHIKDVAF